MALEDTPDRPRSLTSDTRVVPARLMAGDEFSFVYNKGARAGGRRTVTLHNKVQLEGRRDLLLNCFETDKAGIVKVVKVWPSLTEEVSYHKEASVGSNQQSGPCSTAPTLQNPLGKGSSRSEQDTTIGITKIALNLPPETRGYKAEWKREMLELRAHNYASGLLQIGDSTSGSVVSANAERAPPASTREPTVSFFTGSDMIPRLCFEVEEMKESLHGFQYTLDYTTAFMKLCRKLGAGKQAKLILDRKNFYDSSCARQAPRIKELTDAGAMIKILKAEGSGFACMHAKTLIFDKKVVLTGSVNLTHTDVFLVT